MVIHFFIQHKVIDMEKLPGWRQGFITKVYLIDIELISGFLKGVIMAGY